MFSSPAYPVGDIKDGVNVSFYAKVLEAGGVNYTMWLAFPRKLSLRSVKVGAKELDWKLAPFDSRINLIEIPSVSITSEFELNFDNSTVQVNIPEWWREGYFRKIEGVFRKTNTNYRTTIGRNAYGSKKLYRAPSAGDKGSYYVLMRESIGNRVYRVVTSRVGNGDAYTDFSELSVNCDSRQFFVLGVVSEDGAKDKPTKNFIDISKKSKWSTLVVGSSKYDLVNHICKL